MKKLNKTMLFVGLFLLIGSIGFVSAQEKVTKTFQVKKGENLNMKVSGDVKIESWSKDEVTIEGSGLSKDEQEDLKMSQDGSTVKVLLHDNHNATFSVRVPEQFNLDIKTSGGDLICQGKYIGTLQGATAGGDIKIETVKGDVSMATAGGDIKTGDIDGNLKLATAGGDIETWAIGGEGKLSTSGGDITVSRASKSLKVSTSGGDIKIGTVNANVSASTSGGDITVGNVNGIAKLNTSGGDIKLSGAKGKASANTSGGDIQLNNIYGSVSANTSGGKVYVELTPDGSDDSRLASSGGNLTLLIPENAKATIEAVIKVSSKKDLKDRYVIASEYKFDNYVVDEDERKIRGTINLNGGGKTISMATSNSKIEIKKLK